MRLTHKDQQLLGALRANARASTTDIAKTLGISRSTVQKRLERLEANGVIAGYTVQLASQYLDAPVLRLDGNELCIPQHFLRYEHSRETVEAITAKITYDPRYPIFVSGDARRLMVTKICRTWPAMRSVTLAMPSQPLQKTLSKRSSMMACAFPCQTS